MKYDVVVLGGGSAGYIAAITLARKGLKVLVAEKKRFGGTCVNNGCVSSIFLYDTSFLFTRLPDIGSYYGLDINVKLTNSIFNKRDEIVDYLSEAGRKLIENSGAEAVLSNAEIKSEREVRLTDLDKDVEFNWLIIATGSSPDVEGVKGYEYAIDEDRAVNLNYIPNDMIVIGGGYAGVEIAQIYARLGSSVKLLTRSKILKEISDDARQYIYDALDFDGVEIYENRRVKEIMPGGKVVTEDETYEGDLVVLATGRKPNIPRGLCRLGVEYDDDGIVVDKNLRTTNPRVFAAGDVIKKPYVRKTAHIAIVEGLIAALNILGKNIGVEYDYVPQVVYTDPQVAVVGREDKAKRFYKFPLSANTRAIIHGMRDGYVKLGIDEDNRVVYGEIVGYNAEELINSIALAVKMKVNVEELSFVPFAHPSISDAIINAARGFNNLDADVFK